MSTAGIENQQMEKLKSERTALEAAALEAEALEAASEAAEPDETEAGQNGRAAADCEGSDLDVGCSDSSCRRKERSKKEYQDLMNRLSRIEGQVRGVKKMLEKDAYCTDVVVQVAAINAALNSFNKVLLANHIRTCVARDIRAGKDEVIDDLVGTLQKLMK